MQIISNTAITLDGRIAPRHDHFVALAGDEDRRVMSQLRNRADAILVGGNSFRTTPIPLLPKVERLNNEPLRDLPIWNVIVSRKMNFTLRDAYLSETRIKPLFMTESRYAPSDFPLPMVLSDTPITPRWIIDELTARGVKTLLLECGGDLLYPFLRDDLIDDLYITLCPKILGIRGAPSLADGTGFETPFKAFTLVSTRTVEHEIFLHYTRA